LSNFKPRKFFFNNLINNPVGKTIKKNITPNTNGEIILPNNIPNLIHALFNGVSKFEFINPKIKNINEINIAQTLNSSWFISGYKPIIMFMVYCTVIFITSIMLKIFNKDILDLNINKDSKSFWKLKDKKLGDMSKQF